jgi:hypothetical protein
MKRTTILADAGLLLEAQQFGAPGSNNYDARAERVA